MELLKNHQYRRDFQSCHDRKKVAKSENCKINGNRFHHFHRKN